MPRKDRHSIFFNTDFLNGKLKEKSVRGGFYTLSFQAIDSFIRIGSITILARILLPEHFGLIGMVTAVTAFAGVAKDLGLSTATVQQKIITHEIVSNLFWINTITGFAIMLFFSAFSFLIAKFYHEPKLVYITIAISTGFLWGGLTIQHQALLQRRMKFAEIGTVLIGSTLTSTAIAIYLGIKGYGYWALVWREVSRGIFVALGTAIFCRWLPGLPKKNINIGHMVTFGRRIAGFNLIVFLTANLDTILIGKFWGPAQVGIFRQAYNLLYFPVMQLATPVNRVATPTLSFLQDDAVRYRKYYKKMLTTLNFFTMPMIMFLIIFSYDVILVVLGNKWINAADIFRILAISAFIKPASDTTGLLLITCGQTKKYFNLGMIIGIVFLLSYSVGVIWGMLGVAYGHLIASCILLIFRLSYCFKGTPVNVNTFLKAIEKPFISSFVMMTLLIFLRKILVIDDSFLSLIIFFPVASVIYLLTWLVIPDGKENLINIFYDIVTPLNLEKYLVLLNKLRNKV
jgi:PST family polysaccharide transporter